MCRCAGGSGRMGASYSSGTGSNSGGRRDRRRATPGGGGDERFGVEPKTVPPSPAQALMERRERVHRILALLGWLAVGGAAAHAQRASRAVYLDNQGVVRWKDDRQEVALFGANYVLPTASDYRAAGYLHADRKKMIDEDMAHFARMGWDGLRLTFWGDWEASDSAGNLIARARERGIYMLFSPIQLYSSNWPDALQDSSALPPGFGRRFGKARMGTD